MNLPARSIRLLAFVGCAVIAPPTLADDPAITTYQASYQAEYKGKNVGTSDFAVSYDDAQHVYRFSSRLVAKGLLKLVSPKPATERSDFVIRNGMIRPLEYWYEDGTRKGDNNFHVTFDWDGHVAVVTGENGSTNVEIRDSVLDRGSMQVALMTDLARGMHPGPYLLADDDGLKTYEYVAHEDEVLETPLGRLRTLVFVQQREGSSRSNWVWLAPALRYLPVRIEQRRDGETRTAFMIESVEGIARAADPN